MCLHMTGYITRLLQALPNASSETVIKTLQQQVSYKGPERRLI